jgi:hypothetical protein
MSINLQSNKVIVIGQISQLFLSVKTCVAICGLLSPETRQILTYVAKCYTRGTISTPHTTIPVIYSINTAHAIVVDFPPAHTANTPCCCCPWLDNVPVMFPHLPRYLFGVDDFETEFLKSIDFCS